MGPISQACPICRASAACSSTAPLEALACRSPGRWRGPRAARWPEKLWSPASRGRQGGRRSFRRRRPAPRKRGRGDPRRRAARRRCRFRHRGAGWFQGPYALARLRPRRARCPVNEMIPLFSWDPGPFPDERGRFGAYGGRFVPETLIPALDELIAAWRSARADSGYREELAALLRDYAGRPTPILAVKRLAEACEVRARVYLKREDLLHTGAHKVNNTLGQALLARRMGKKRVIAETGAGQHGVATATVCALLGLECVVYMGTEDVRRQAPNVS